MFDRIKVIRGGAHARVNALLATTGLVVPLAFGLTACGGSNSPEVKSILNPATIGTWKYVSISSGTSKVICPGTALFGTSTLTCGADAKITLSSDGKFVDNLTGSSGEWFSDDTHIMMDDDQNADNPIVYTAVMNGNNLILKTFEGGFVAEFARSGAASTLTHRDIVAANPGLDYSNLVDPGLIGTWQYKSISYNGNVILCPGDTGITGIKCGANEVVEFTADGKFTDTVTSNTHDAGIWYAYHGRLYLDDYELIDHDPVAWTYSIKSNSMTLAKWGDKFIVNAVKTK